MAARNAWSMVKTAFKNFGRDNVMILSAALAFYAMLSLAPLLILLVTLTSRLGEDTQQRVVERVESTVGPQASGIIETIIQQASAQQQAASLSAWIGLGATLLAALGAFIHLQTSLNRIFKVRVERGLVFTWLWKRLLSLLLILLIGAILVASVVISSMISVIFPTGGVIWQVVNIVVSLIVFTAVFMAMYKILPDVQLAWKDTLVGGILTAILFMAGNYGISQYIGRTGTGSVYGAAGSLVILLLWIFYTSIIVLFGAELTYAYTLHYGHKPTPGKFAEQTEQPELAPEYQEQR
jgi:membrane protein